MRTKPRLLLKTNELLASPRPPMLVEAMIPRQGLIALTSDPNMGKTFFALELVKSIVLKRPMFGRFATRRGSVLFVGQDCSTPQYAQQARKVFGEDANIVETIPVGNKGETTQRRPFDHVAWMMHQRIDLTQTADVAAIVAATRAIPDIGYDPDSPIDYIPVELEHEDGTKYVAWEAVYGNPFGVALIVFDSWRKVHTANESDNGEMDKILSNLRIVAEQTDAAILLLHHHGWASDGAPSRMRGASSQLGALDTHLEIGGTPHNPEKALRFRKVRDVSQPDFHYKMITDESSCRFEFVNFVDTSTILDEAEEFIGGFEKGAHIVTAQLVEWLVGVKGYSEPSARTKSSKLLRGLSEKQIVSALDRGHWKVM